MVELGPPIGKIDGSVQLPASKSISNRLLILQHLYRGNISLSNLSSAEDSVLLGAALEQIKNKNTATIDVKDAGTDLRFLTALLAMTAGEWTLTGSERLRQRPIGELVQALKSTGADIEYDAEQGFPPLHITGKKLNGTVVEIRSEISSQFVSALLLVAPFFEKPIRLRLLGKTVSTPYIKMTVDMLRMAGVQISSSETEFTVHPLEHFPPLSFTVEPDWSAASYYYSICALSKGSRIFLPGLHSDSLQGDAVLTSIYSQLGVKTEEKNEGILLVHTGSSTAPFTYDFSSCPDIAQTVAVTCLGLNRKADLCGLKTLKIKETDRIEAMKTELEKLGADVTTSPERFHLIPPPASRNQKTRISTYGDHRMAMSFAPLAALLPVLHIEAPQVTNKSYPGFWDDLRTLGFSVNLQPR